MRAIKAFTTFVGDDDFDFTKVNKKLVFRFIQQLETNKLSSVTIKGYVSALGLVFDYLLVLFWIMTTPRGNFICAT